MFYVKRVFHVITLAALILMPLALTMPQPVQADTSDVGSARVEKKSELVPAPTEILVKLKSGVGGDAGVTLAQDKGVNVLRTTRKGYQVISVPAGKTAAAFAQEYAKNALVESAEPNIRFRTQFTPNDTYFSTYQWNFDANHLQMEQVWDITGGGSTSVVVAVVDTGVAYENYSGYLQADDLADTNFTSGYDFVNNDAHPNDDEGHGTHVTGTIAQSTNNGAGVAGMAYNTTIMPVKVLDDGGWGTLDQIADGIDFAVANGADIINMSLGSYDNAPVLETAVADAVNADVVVIAATGNDGSSPIMYPALYDGVIGVGSTDYNDQRAYYSNYGTGLDVVAPGGDVYADENSDGRDDGILQETFDGCGTNVDVTAFRYCLYQGTSMATPHVSGAAALLLAEGVLPQNVQSVLESTAYTGMSGYSVSEYGAGRIDLLAALGGDATPPSNVSGLSVSASGTAATISWTNPSNSDFAGTRIVRKAGSAPANKNDGTLVFEGTGTSASDSGLTPDTTYYYGAFALDNDGNYASGTFASAFTNSTSIITGAGPGGAPHVRSFTPGNSAEGDPSSLYAYATTYRGGVRVATGDIDADGTDEIITGTGENGGPHLRVFEKNGSQKGIEFFPFHKSFRGGMDVASGDFDGDGKEDIAVSQFSKGQAWVKVYRYNSARTILFEKNVFGAPEIGSTVALGDIDKDGADELIVGAGNGGGPQIRVFDYSPLSRTGILKPISFFAFDQNSRTGVDVAAGDTDGDGKAEIAVSQLKGGQAWVKLYRYNSDKTVLANFNAFGSPEIGANVSLADLTGDGKADLIVGAGKGGGPQVRGFSASGSALSTNFFAYSTSFRGGVDIAGGSF